MEATTSWLIVTERKSRNLRSKRKQRCINRSNRHFYIFELKNYACKKSRSNQCKTSNSRSKFIIYDNPMSQGDSSLVSSNSVLSQQSENEISENTDYCLAQHVTLEEDDVGLHFSVNDITKILSENLSPNFETYQLRNIRSNTTRIQKIKSAISNVFRFNVCQNRCKVVQETQTESCLLPGVVGDSEARIMSDNFLDLPMHSVNTKTRNTEQDIKENALLLAQNQHFETINEVSRKDMTVSTKSSTTQVQSSGTIRSIPSLGPIKEKIFHQNPYFINESICNASHKNSDDSSDIATDDDEKTIIDEDLAKNEVGLVKNKDGEEEICSTQKINKQGNFCQTQSTNKETQQFNTKSVKTSAPYGKCSRKIALSNETKNVTELLNSLLKCVNKPCGQETSHSTSTTHNGFEMSNEEGPSTSSTCLEKQVREIKQSYADGTPTQALMEIFGERSHITEILNNTLEHKLANQKLDSRFRSARNVEDNVKNEEQAAKITKIIENFPPSKTSIEKPSNKSNVKTDYMDTSLKSSHKEEQAQSDLDVCPYFHLQKKTSSSMGLTETNLKDVTDFLLRLQNQTVHIEQHILSLKQIFEIIKLDISTNLNNINQQEALSDNAHDLNLQGNDTVDKVVYSINCNELCQTFSKLECVECGSKTSKLEKIRSLKLHVGPKIIVSVAFFIGFMCVDFIRK